MAYALRNVVIRTFADRRTKAVFEDVPVKGLGPDGCRAARRKLLMLDRSVSLCDLRVPPGNRPEALEAIVPGNTASGSTTSGGSASSGAKGTL